MPDAPGNSKNIWRFDPRSIAGCVIWSDASQLTTLSGGTWQNLATAGTYTISCTGTVNVAGKNGLNTVSLTTAQGWGTSPVVSLSSYTLFWLGRQTGVTNARVLNSTTNNQIYGYWSGYKKVLYFDTSPQYLTGYPSDPSWDLMSHSRTVSGPYTYNWNGLSVYSGSSSDSLAMSGLAINIGTSFNEPSTCEIGEIILYDRALSTAQIQQVEGYLAWKWLDGIPPNLLNFTQLTSAGSRNYTQPVFSSNLQTGLMYPPASGTPSAFYPYTTADGGNTWTQSTSAGAYAWSCTAVSPDGSTMYVGQYVNPGTAGNLYKSTNGGTSWTQVAAGLSTTWQSVSCSSNAQIVYAPHGTGCLISSNSGSTWISSSGVTSNCVPSCCSWDGTKAYMGGFGGYIARTSNTGITWTTVTSSPLTNTYYFAMACSSDGTKVAATGGTNNLYLSSNSGVSWIICPTITNVVLAIQMGLAMSASGNTLYVMLYTGSLYKSMDFGGSWTLQTGITFSTVGGYGTIGGGVKCSYDGNTVYCCTNSNTSSAFPYLGTPRSAHTFYSIKPHLRTFQPTDIDGCALWLDAADATTLTLSGANVTQWRDKSGYNYHAVGYNNTATYTATGLNSSPALAFSSTKSMVAPVPAGTFPTAISVFVVYQFTGTLSSSAVYSLINRTFSSGSAYAAPFSVYQNNSSMVRYIGIGTNQLYSFVTGTTFTNTTPSIYYFNIASNSNTVWNESVNGTATAYTLTTGTAGYADTASNVCIGGRLDTAVYMDGVISEVIMYNTTLTAVERQQVEGYLAKKWNMSNVIAPFTDPTSISGCTLWLDAQDASTITGTSPVTQWNDKSGKGSNTLAYSGTPARVTSAINGYPAMRFNGSSYFWGSNVNTTPNATFFLIATVEPNSGGSAAQQYTCAYAFSSITAGENDYAYASSMSGPVLPNAGPSFVLQPFQRPITGTVTNFAPGYSNVFLLTNVFSNGTVYSYQNGNLIGSVASTGVFNIGRYAIGCQTYSGSTGFNYQWTGYIGEVIAYSNALTSDQRQQVEYYLSTKWGLTTGAFNPNMIPGCKVWLDAADATTITYSSGSNVSQWKDKSSNAYGFAATNVVTSNFGLTTNPSLYFNGTSSYLSSAVSIANPYSFFVVCYGASAANNARILSATNGATTDGILLVGFVSGNTAILTGNGGWGATDPYPTTSLNTWSLIDASVSGTNTQGYLGGVAQTNRIGNTALGLATLIIGNSVAGGASPWLGYCSEVVFYSGVLTTLQRQQVEYYLANKWGLTTAAAFSPKPLGYCAIWFDAADTSTITATGGTTLATWSNKGDVGGTATPTLGTISTNVATWAGRNIVQFAQTSYLSVTLSIPYQPRAWFAVFRQTYQLNSTNQNFLIFGSFTSGYDQVVGPEYNRTMNEFRNGIASMVSTTGGINGYNTFNVYNWTNSAASTLSNRIAINGTATTLTTSSLASGYATGSVAYRIMAGYVPSADIAEIICMNREITTLERQQIEYYLAQKWGLSLSNSFSPLQIPSCALWLDAADATTFTYSSGSNVSQWNDKSGTANNAVRGSWGTYPTRTTSNTVLFSNSASSTQYLNTQAGRQTTQEVTFVMAVKILASTGTTNGGNFLDQRKESTGGAINAITSTVFLSRDVVANSSVNVNYTFPLNTTLIVTYQSKLNTTAAYVNGTLIGTMSSTLNIQAADTKYTTIGALTDVVGTSGSQITYSSACEFSELMMFNSYLTATQRQQVEYYLAQKWGLPLTFNFSPLQIPSCALWLDASGSSNFSFSSGTTIASWIDKSGLGNNATPYTPFSASTTATYSSTSNAVYFPGATGLGTTIAVPTNRVQSGFFVAITSNVSAGVLQGCRNGDSREFRNNTNTSLQTLQQNVAALLSSTGTAALSIFAYTDDGTTITHSVNGTATTGTSSATFASGTQLTLGISGNNEHMVGYMYEAIIYSNALTTVQRQQIEYYLAKKWGISGPSAVSYGPSVATYGPAQTTYGPPAVSFAGGVTSVLPTTHPFAILPPATTLPFSPLNISGCCLWLDANDPAGTGLQPAAGALAIWRDKSGSYNHMTAVGTTPTFSNSLPGAVTFGGAGYYSNATPVFSNIYTAFFVYKQDSGNNGPLYTTADTGGFNGFFANYNGSGPYLVTSDSGYWNPSSPAPFPFGQMQLAVTSYASNAVGGSVSLYYNGSNVITTTQTGTITYSAFFLGRRNPEILAGTVYEVIGYAGTLTTSQRQRVEGYLAQKWKF